MAATRSNRRKTEKPPEDRVISKEKEKIKKKIENKPVENTVELERQDDATSSRLAGVVEELPYAAVKPLPVVSRSWRDRKHETREEDKGSTESHTPVEPEGGFKNQAPLQSDERAKTLIKGALRNPISITTEDLLNISEPARQELRKLLTKKRVEKKSVAFVSEKEKLTESEEDAVIYVEKLPEVSYEILEEARDSVPKGSLVIGDPIVQYLSTLGPGEKPKRVVVASESHGLRAVYPLINGVGEVESLLDGGSQIVSMAKDVAIDLEISWDPDITVHMQSANRSLEQTLGLAKNVPFLFGHITVYLQVHVMQEPAYKVLLGRPFDTVTESLVKNEKDGSQCLTLTDPNTGERCVMHTHERGKPPTVLKKPVKEGFQ